MFKFLKYIFSVEEHFNKTIFRFLGFKISFKSKYAKLNAKVVELEQKLNTYEYMQNYFIDVTKLPKARGTLRKVQKIQANFLHILHLILKKYNISYWINYGTLLGAVRHKGFIPWDDDLDLGMMREDYLKVPEIFNKELSSYGFSIRLDSAIKFYWEYSPSQRFQLGEIYPHDLYFKKITDENEKKDLDKKANLCYQEFLKEFDLRESRKSFALYNEIEFNKIQKLIEKLTKNIVLDNNKEISDGNIFVGAEILPYGCANNYTYDTIFPLKELSFEGCVVNVPSDYDKYLTTLFGNYWLLPKNTIRNHLTESNDIENRFGMFDLDKILSEFAIIKKEVSTKMAETLVVVEREREREREREGFS